MIEIKIDKSCQSWGQCIFDAPEIFDLVNSERKTWKYYADDSLEEKIKIATNHCPNAAISFERKPNE